MSSERQSTILKPTSTFQEHMDKIKKRTSINPKYIVIGLAISLVLTTTKIFSTYVTCLVGVVCPTYLSLKAIQSPEEGDDKLFLTYWVVYGIFSIIDLFTYFLINLIPFYYTFKLLFLIWLFMPNFKGSIYVYNWVIGPLFKKYEGFLDSKVKKILKQGENYAESAKNNLEQNTSKIIKGLTKLTKKVE